MRASPIASTSRTRQPGTGELPDAGVGVAEDRPLRRQEEVAVQRQLEAAGDRRPVDGADHGDVDLPRPRVVGSGRAVRGSRPVEPNRCRSSPAQKAGSAPVRTITNARPLAPELGDGPREFLDGLRVEALLRRSGRVSVTTPTGPRRSMCIRSRSVMVMMVSNRCSSRPLRAGLASTSLRCVGRWPYRAHIRF